MCVLTAAMSVMCTNRPRSDTEVTPSDSEREEIASDTEVKIPELSDTIIKYSDFCSKVEYVPLERTEKSAIGVIHQMMITNDGDIIVFDIDNRSILRFSESGQFLNRIGQIGRGGNEYSDVESCAYDPYKEDIVIWDNPSKKIRFFDLQGNATRDLDVSWSMGRLSILGPDNFVYYVEDKEESHGNTLAYKYVISNKSDNEVIAEYKVLDPIYKTKTLWLNAFMSIGNKSVYGKTMFSPFVYSISENSYSPKYHVCYDDEQIPEKWFDLPIKSFYKKMHSHRNIVYCSDFFETEKYFIVSSVKGGICYLSVQERSGEKRTFSGFVALDDMFGDKVMNDYRYASGGTTTLKYVNDSTCYFLIDPAYECMNNAGNEGKIKQQIESLISDPEERELAIANMDEYFRMLENDNPVLIKCTLK